MTCRPRPCPSAPRSTRIPPSGRSGSRSKGGGSRSSPSTRDAHAEALYEGSNGDAAREAVWTYLFDGPYREPRRISRRHRGQGALDRSAVLRRHRQRLGARGRLSDASCASTRQSRHRGRQHHVHAGDATDGRRDRGAISVREICLRRARLSPLRVEVQRPQRAVDVAPRSASASPSRGFSAST